MTENNLSTVTIARYIFLVLIVVNHILVTFGYHPLPISETEIFEIVSLTFIVFVTFLAWWQNHKFLIKCATCRRSRDV